jgi:error-prone DNA polymerase
MSYAELQITTNISFLRGGAHPHELAVRAAELGISAIGIADWNSLAGVVRAHLAAREIGLKLLIGSRLNFRDGSPSILCYPMNRQAYGRLCRLLTLGKRRGKKAECLIDYADFAAHGEDQIAIAIAPECLDEAFKAGLARLARDFPGRSYLALSRRFTGDDSKRLYRLDRLGRAYGLPRIATNDVLYHTPERRQLQDVLTCIREICTIDEAGFRLEKNAERHLKSAQEMARLFQDYPEALAATQEIVRRCKFSLEELRYEYPDEIAPDGEPPQERLIRLTWEGAKWRYPSGVPHEVKKQIETELDLIGRFNYAPFFLTVEDIVREANRLGVLNQGRGSAANSAVCYVLGITGVNPALSNCLFERFISDARDEPPDIDVDFEHERREEIIQYIYDRFGRHRAGLCSTVVCYRTRGAIRDVGKALGLSPDVCGALAGTVWGWNEHGVAEKDVKNLGLDASDRRLGLALKLAHDLISFPRHLSQHPGGFIITRGRLDELIPIENAAMDERTVVEWDKTDIEALGMLKVDVLALGMLTCLAKGFKLLKDHYGMDFNLATVPAEEKAVYEMISRADTIGVFQIESRAQQTMLPRLRPKTFYDLVIEVAIVRPGPIQGQMVHPYLRRRQGKEKPDYDAHSALRPILEKTLGVPLFQEQCMRIAIVAAGFKPSRADELRRAMATFKKVGTIHTFRDEFIEGMVTRGYDRTFAERCFSQIQGFGTYGFPESHAASFALLVYVSAWVKCRYPDVFCCALLNSQPMGFYAPAQIVRDAREHGVDVRAIDVNHSQWDHTLEAGKDGLYAVRLGLRLISGLSQKDAEKLIAHRGNGYASLAEIVRRASLSKSTMQLLAGADAFGSMTLPRREALWNAISVEPDTLPLLAISARNEIAVNLPSMPLSQTVMEDYDTAGLSLRRHPVSFLRENLKSAKIVSARDLKTLRNGSRIAIAGLVLFRQMPGTAKGTIFVTIEDETGTANLILWKNVWEKHRQAAFGAKLLFCQGTLQREDGVIHVVARRLTDWSERLRGLYNAGGDGERPIRLKSRDFR